MKRSALMLAAAALGLSAFSGAGTEVGRRSPGRPRVNKHLDYSEAAIVGGYRKGPRGSHKQKRRIQLKKNARRAGR